MLNPDFFVFNMLRYKYLPFKTIPCMIIAEATKKLAVKLLGIGMSLEQIQALQKEINNPTSKLK